MKALLRAVPTLMLVLVGATSFLLSYVAIRDVSINLGAVPANLAWAVPVCIDGGILAGSAAIWSSSYHRRRRDPLAFLTVATLLATSVLVNVSHAGDAPLAKWIAALPPLILLACLEIVASQHRRDLDTAPQAGTAAESPVVAAGNDAPALAADPEPGPAPVLTPTPAPAPAPVLTAARDASPVPVAHPAAALEDAPAPAASPAPWVETVSAAAPPIEVVETVAETAPPAAARTAPEPARTTAPVAAAAQRPRRISAAAPTTGPAPSSTDPGTDTAGGDRVKQLFHQHVNAGGDPHDRTLAGTLAEQTGMSVQYVRRVLRPLREQVATA